ncbi:hypothetical protein HAX54_022096 [Datura stramonium]|uniref:Uncharacterized protein n=1 Tax=Datura stramonium TaxID=4076 RepID=A0ABS8Y7F2_DATST|nr:hypothetical protein [Datura stramonium]
MEVTLLVGKSLARAFPGRLRELEAILLVGNRFVTVEQFLEVGGDVLLPRFTVESQMSSGSFSPSSGTPGVPSHLGVEDRTGDFGTEEGDRYRVLSLLGERSPPQGHLGETLNNQLVTMRKDIGRSPLFYGQIPFEKIIVRGFLWTFLRDYLGSTIQR